MGVAETDAARDGDTLREGGDPAAAEAPTKILVADDEAEGVTRRAGARPPPVAITPPTGHQPLLSDARPEEPDPEITLQRVVASRVGFTVIVLLAALPIGLVSVLFARAAWVSAMGAVAIGLAAAGLLALRHYGSASSDPRAGARYHRIALFTALAGVPLIYTMGTYTGFAGVLGMFVLLYDMSAPPKNALLVTAAVGVPHIVLHAAVVTGQVDDLGVLTVEGSSAQRTLSMIGVCSVYVLAFAAGQTTRRRTQKTLAELHQAARQVALREAMLREARLALRQAGGIGQTGRFTDQRFGGYDIGVILGRGGMGEVYEARGVDDGAPAAVKFLRPPKSDVDDAWERFAREAKIVASLSSPHVVRVLSVGEEGPIPYIAMERLAGRDLSQRLREEALLAPEEVAQMVRQCAEGLAAAHQKAIVHRDVKPHNLFRCDDGTWKILDFGVARLFDGSQTVTGNLIGTPGYMAPEQLREDLQPDHRTDIHALAAVAYRALTGHPAFPGTEMAAVLKRVSTDLPARPSSLAPVPAAVDAVLRVALAKSPADRFGDIRELGNSLDRAIRRGELDPAIGERAALLDARLSWSAPSSA